MATMHEMMTVEIIVRQDVDDISLPPEMEVHVKADEEVIEAVGGSDNMMALAGKFLRNAADQYDKVKDYLVLEEVAR